MGSATHMIGRLIHRLRSLLALPARLPEDFKSIERAVKKASERTAKLQARDALAAATEIALLRKDADALRDEIRRGLLQYHLQLGRLSAVVGGRPDVRVVGGRLPVTVDRREVTRPQVPPSNTADDWFALDRCPACRTPER